MQETTKQNQTVAANQNRPMEVSKYDHQVQIRFNDTPHNANMLVILEHADAQDLLARLQKALQTCDWCNGTGALPGPGSDSSYAHRSDPGATGCSNCHGTGRA